MVMAVLPVTSGTLLLQANEKVTYFPQLAAAGLLTGINPVRLLPVRYVG